MVLFVQKGVVETRLIDVFRPSPTYVAKKSRARDFFL